ncbi:MAG: hypothetical protein R2856_24155, partial [Caldilineaceae bacterium]
NNLGALGTEDSYATGINNAGQVIGYSFTEHLPTQHAFLWENGAMQDLGALGGIYATSGAADINEAGQVVGSSYKTPGMHATLWEDGTMLDLGTLGGLRSVARDINEAGRVIGDADTADGEAHAFIWIDGTMYDLGTLGGNRSQALAINEAGQVVGRSTTADGESHAVLFTPVPLIFVPGMAGSYLKSGDDEYWPGNSITTQHELLELRNQSDITNSLTITAPDVLRRPFLGAVDIYGGLLEFLTGEGGYVETVGCREETEDVKPTLFVFPYDWRQHNATNAEKLNELIACVRRLYPGVDVDILAHSMGGLVARRYILDAADEHHVNRLITIGSPFLGAPKAIYVLESGKFLPAQFHIMARRR